VFGGAAWVLFAKKPSKRLEVYNDYNSDLVNLFLCVKDRLIAFTREVGFLHINSRQEFDHFIKFLRKEIPANQFLQDEIDAAKSLFSEPELSEVLKILNEKTELYDVQRAAAFYKVIRHSYGSGCKSFDNKPVNVQGMLNDLPQNSERLRNVIIENMDFETVIRRYDGPDAFFYCDPPYVFTEGHYAVEFTRDDHIRLQNVLSGIEGKFLLSYNDCELVKELYQDFHIVEIVRPNTLKFRYESGSEFPELLIANYDLHEQVNKRPIQLSMEDCKSNGKVSIKSNLVDFRDFRKKQKNSPPIFITNRFGKEL
jgi:DNA adenine methylase